MCPAAGVCLWNRWHLHLKINQTCARPKSQRVSMDLFMLRQIQIVIPFRRSEAGAQF